MRRLLALLPLLVSAIAMAQTPMDAFHWVNFHDSKDEPTVAWVTASMRTEKWTAIREIGVELDAALVITSRRATPQSSPDTDVYTIWSVGLASKRVDPLFTAHNPRVLDWTAFSGQYTPELAMLFDNCSACQATTSFTSLYYSFPDHAWRARWLQGANAAVLRSGAVTPGVHHTEVYGLLTQFDGRQILGKWDHFDYGQSRPAEDYVYQYSVNAMTGLDQTQLLAAPHSEELELRLCQIDPQQGEPALAALTGGQQSDLCQGLVEQHTRPLRRPVTSPPANNQGRSSTAPPKKH